MPVLPLLGLLLTACGLMESGPENLAPSSALNPACYDGFRPDNHPQVSTSLSAGDKAVDFELKTVKGEPVHLAELLKTGKPVALMAASYTCDRFQKRERGFGKFSKDFDGKVHSVVVYTTEAHPVKDPSPYRGRVWQRAYSDRREPSEWIGRAKHAKDLDLPSSATVLVDEMDNPFWCTYGPCPNCAFLIAPDGKLEAVHKWYDPKTFTESTKALLDKLDKADKG